MSADETGYNGWANYPTWAVNLWLTNEEPLYRKLRAKASGVTLFTAEPGEARGQLADAIKDWVTNDLAPDLGASFPADLLGWALAQVDWFEIAEAALEDVK